MPNKKQKEKRIENVEPRKDIANDIDDIFATKRTLDPPTEKEKNPKSTKPPTVANVKSAQNSLATVENQVHSAKLKQSNKHSQRVQDDDFADIRGTKKSNPCVSSPILINRKAHRRWPCCL
jgi:hypothetical protein